MVLYYYSDNAMVLLWFFYGYIPVNSSILYISL